jgi:hypothetical protein
MTLFGLVHIATVYTPNGTTGEYTVVAQSNLPCRLVYIQNAPGALENERAAIGENRRLLWSDEYVMPDEAQVDINGTRWNVRAGTYGTPTGPDGTVIYRRCEVTQAVL